MDSKGTKNKIRSGNVPLRRSRHALCPVCNKIVELISFAAAAEAFKTDTQDIELLARSRSLHRVHNRNGKVLVCSISLFECFDNRKTRLLDSHFVEKAREQWTDSRNR